jgi:NAD(P)-dependent dehydrogenase (short-subunit alcohol dehydrogenase family)
MVALVTGANAGIGFETAKDLYEKGATVIVAGRSPKRVHEAIAQIEDPTSRGQLIAGDLDLASLESVERFSNDVLDAHDRLDLLINNAGVMIPPEGTSADGFELQFGINYIGHFALTGRLFPLLESTNGARVVTLSSIAHRGAAIDFENFKLEKPYNEWREYGQSKLADLIFAVELAKRLETSGSSLISLAAHPGFSKTELQKNMDSDALSSLDLMTAEQGAQPTLMAALSPHATNGQYWGPDGAGETSGEPAPATIDEAALDQELNARLFDWTLDTLGLQFP